MTLVLLRTDAHQPLHSQDIYLQPGSFIGQAFTSHHPNLTRVSVCLRNPARTTDKLRFSLYEATTSANPITTFTFNAGIINNLDCTKFSFPPLANSANKKYVVTFSFANPHPQGSIYAEAHTNDYSEGSLIINHATFKTSDLHFRTFYQQAVQDSLQELFSLFQARIFADKLFFVTWFFIILSLLRLLWKKR